MTVTRAEASACRASDLEALIPVVKGREPLVISVHRASDIVQVLKLAREQHLKLVLEGADADLVVWDGDPLETTSAPAAILIKGAPQPLRSRDLDLRDRYLGQDSGGPAAP